MVINGYGVVIDFDAAQNIMDEELMDLVSEELSPCPDQIFFDRYCELHYGKYGEEFECARKKPCY